MSVADWNDTFPLTPSVSSLFDNTPNSDQAFNGMVDSATSMFTTVFVVTLIVGVLVLGAIGYCIYNGHKRSKKQEQEQLRQRQQPQVEQQQSLQYEHVLMMTPTAPTYHPTLINPSLPIAKWVPSAPTATTNWTSAGFTDSGSTATSGSTSTGSAYRSANDSSQLISGTWDDPLLVASRIPMESIFTHSLISKGGYGEVYKGSYAGETVAIKKLLPETRRDLQHIAIFFSEIKLMAGMQHDHIVRYIGVAWNALSDASVVTEFMAGGDLRAALTHWEFVDARPQGVDKQKATIALHVAHALTYLHSLSPVVLHRDLKSKNILLDEHRWSAKVTDFGVARERSDRTMTAAVGTLLWMAPEVMMGERYDDKADVFSFGVVLSELDTHAMPYADVKEKLVAESGGRPLPDTALLQRIMTGRVQVSFSPRVRTDVRALGEACVALDPTQRPTAAHVLHAMHQICQSL